MPRGWARSIGAKRIGSSIVQKIAILVSFVSAEALLLAILS